MTLVDKIGAVTAVIIFALMVAAYFYSFRPKNKQKFEDLRNFVNDDDAR